MTDALRLLEAAATVGGWVRPLALDGWVFTIGPDFAPIAFPVEKIRPEAR